MNMPACENEKDITKVQDGPCSECLKQHTMLGLVISERKNRKLKSL